jgi:segregation and condensation protein B
MLVQQIIEALIFAADAPMKPAQIMELFQNEEFFGIKFDELILEDALASLQVKYQEDSFVFELRQIDGGYQFYTKKEYYPFVKHAALAKSNRRMSRASLETLSIIAYKQPITKTEIEFIRGVNCDYAVRKLLDRNLIEIRGRSDVAGKPLLYGTTAFFMEYFSLNDLKDLPKLDEVHSDEVEFQAQFKVVLSGEEEDEEESQSDLPPEDEVRLTDSEERDEEVFESDFRLNDLEEE